MTGRLSRSLSEMGGFRVNSLECKLALDVSFVSKSSNSTDSDDAFNGRDILGGFCLFWARSADEIGNNGCRLMSR